MSSKHIGGLLCVLLLTGCNGSHLPNEANSPNDANLSPVTFTEESHVNIHNPDRGFYDADYALNLQKDYDRFADAKAKGYSLVYAPLSLHGYETTAVLPDALITTITHNLADANASGVKLIFRIKYRVDRSGDDPSRTIIMGHLNQLKPLLQTYKEVISVVQAGTIGAWGEWHSFTGEYAQTHAGYKTNRKAIIEKLVEIFPHKYIQIRTPMHKEELFGASSTYGEKSTRGEITPEIAYSDDIRAKIGHHNDCFLADKTDMGTYPSDAIDFWKNYVVNDSKYAPVGGETCGIGSGEDATLSSCPHALAELQKLHYAYLNDVYHPDVLQKWKDEGCYQTIQENLGYRLVATKLTMHKTPQTLTLSLSIHNKGYASPYVPSDVAFILANGSHTYPFPQDTDIRTFYSQETKPIDATLSLDGLPSGTYCLYLQIGKGHSAIRLSNQDLWDASTRTNTLTCNLEI